jgi:hypothetical protein
MTNVSKTRFVYERRRTVNPLFGPGIPFDSEHCLLNMPTQDRSGLELMRRIKAKSWQ